MTDPKNSQGLGTYLEPRLLCWESLAKIATSRRVGGFIIFLIVIPFVISVMKMISDVIPIDFAYLSLTWFLGYTAGLLFFIGTVLVNFFCPDIVKPERNFSAIKKEGRTMQYVIQMMRETYFRLPKIKSKRARANHFIRCAVSEKYVENIDDLEDLLPPPGIGESLTRREVWTLVEKANFKNDSMQEVYWTVHWFAGNVYPRWRRICFGFFAAGATLVFALLVVQCYRVLSFVLR